MRRSILLVPALLAAALAGCRDEAIASLESTRDRVCACGDATCVNAAMAQLEDRPTKHQRKAEAIARDITDCVARVYRKTDAVPPAQDAGPEDAAPAEADALPAPTPADAATPP